MAIFPVGVGTIAESILGDIANAIREQNGGSETYKPGDMAAAVAALDGTKSGDAVAHALKDGVGVISSSVFSDIAAAIRAHNGLSTKYKPREMAQAIRAFTWDTGLKPRAILYNRGRSIELNYLDGPQLASGNGEVLGSWEISTKGYASDSDVPWHDVREQILFVRVDSSFKGVACADISHWFQGISALTNVTGFNHISGVKKAA